MNDQKPKFALLLYNAGMTISYYCKWTGRARSTVEQWVYGVNEAPKEAIMLMKLRIKHPELFIKR